MIARAAVKAGKQAAKRARYATEALPQADATEISRLDSGIRVATGSLEGRFPAVGVYVDVGTRYETVSTTGCTQMLDKLAFQATQNRSTEECTRELIDYGGQFFHQAGRDGALVQALVTGDYMEAAVDLMLDSMFAPLINDELLESQVEAALYDNQLHREKPEMWCPETLNDVAFNGNTVGNPWPSADEALRSLNPATVSRFHRMWYRPERMVIAGVGVEHAPFVELVQRVSERYLPAKTPVASGSRLATQHPQLRSAFRNLSTTPAASASATNDVDPINGESTASQLAAQRAHYTGGELMIEDANAEWTRLLVAYEAVPLHDPDLYAVAVLHTMLGGGSSFSSGGPGKGMYSRFYTDVLARYAIIDHAASLHNMFADAGIFGMHLAVKNDAVQHAAPLVATGLASALVAPKKHMFDRRAEMELARAKNQLQMNLLQTLESRLVQVEDLGRQVLQLGRREPDEEMTRKIQAVTLADIQRVAERVLKHGKPTILAHGHLNKLGNVQQILRNRGLGGQLSV